MKQRGWGLRTMACLGVELYKFCKCVIVGICVCVRACVCVVFFFLSTNPLCVFRPITVMFFLSNLVGPELFLSRDMKEHTRFLPFLFSFVNAFIERTMNFKSAISINCHLN